MQLFTKIWTLSLRFHHLVFICLATTQKRQSSWCHCNTNTSSKEHFPATSTLLFPPMTISLRKSPRFRKMPPTRLFSRHKSPPIPLSKSTSTYRATCSRIAEKKIRRQTQARGKYFDLLPFSFSSSLRHSLPAFLLLFVYMFLLYQNDLTKTVLCCCYVCILVFICLLLFRDVRVDRCNRIKITLNKKAWGKKCSHFFFLPPLPSLSLSLLLHHLRRDGIRSILLRVAASSSRSRVGLLWREHLHHFHLSRCLRNGQISHVLTSSPLLRFAEHLRCAAHCVREDETIRQSASGACAALANGGQDDGHGEIHRNVRALDPVLVAHKLIGRARCEAAASECKGHAHGALHGRCLRTRIAPTRVAAAAKRALASRRQGRVAVEVKSSVNRRVASLHRGLKDLVGRARTAKGGDEAIVARRAGNVVCCAHHPANHARGQTVVVEDALRAVQVGARLGHGVLRQAARVATGQHIVSKTKQRHVPLVHIRIVWNDAHRDLKRPKGARGGPSLHKQDTKK